MIVRLSRFFLLAAAVVIASSSFPPVLAEDRGLKQVYDYVIEINGVLDPGWQVLAGQQRNRLLLLSPPGDQALMVMILDKSVRPADTKLLLKHDGMIDVLAGGLSATRIIPLAVDGPTASFTLDGRTFTIKLRPPLIGPHTIDDLVQDRPDFGDGIKKYQPDQAAVTFLKEYSKPTEVQIFFGSWCSVCEAVVPKFLKSVEVAGNSKLQVKLIGVARGFESNAEFVKQNGIRGLPTFIIRQDGVEVGRIVGAPKEGTTVEGSVVDALKAKS